VLKRHTNHEYFIMIFLDNDIYKLIVDDKKEERNRNPIEETNTEKLRSETCSILFLYEFHMKYFYIRVCFIIPIIINQSIHQLLSYSLTFIHSRTSTSRYYFSSFNEFVHQVMIIIIQFKQ